MNSITIQSHAKINLGLLVKAKRPDGYHKIETIFVPIKLSDILRLKKIPHGIIVKVPNNKLKLPIGKTNLAYKAADLFFNKTKIQKGVEITIEKHIPIGAGLGGGSSNAGSVLTGLNILFNQPLNKRELNNLALKIGMDVPFFLIGTTCYATGRGEILRPFEIPRLNIALHFPGFPVITKWAYSKLKTPKAKLEAKKTPAQGERALTNGRLSLKILRKKLANGDLSDLQYLIQNSFEDLVFALYPDLARIKEFFLTHGAYAASLSGSGSAIFGLVDKQHISTMKTALKRNRIKAVFTESIGS